MTFSLTTAKTEVVLTTKNFDHMEVTAISRWDGYQIRSNLAVFYILFNRALSAISLIILTQHVYVLNALKRNVCNYD